MVISVILIWTGSKSLLIKNALQRSIIYEKGFKPTLFFQNEVNFSYMKNENIEEFAIGETKEFFG